MRVIFLAILCSSAIINKRDITVFSIEKIKAADQLLSPKLRQHLKCYSYYISLYASATVYPLCLLLFCLVFVSPVYIACSLLPYLLLLYKVYETYACGITTPLSWVVETSNRFVCFLSVKCKRLMMSRYAECLWACIFCMHIFARM